MNQPTNTAPEGSVEKGKQLVEAFISSVGLDPNKQTVQLKKGLGWWLSKGSALIYIFVNEYSNMNTVRIVAPILRLPSENLLPFYRRLLELNFTIANCAFAIDKDVVVLMKERAVSGLDSAELSLDMDLLSDQANLFDDKLSHEFGAPMYKA